MPDGFKGLVMNVETDQYCGLPFNGDVVCRRDPDGSKHFNIEQSIILHSPTGMEWGYGGSGPADFALNILARFTDPQTAGLLHQAFKWKFIATLPEEGGTIKGEDIRLFVKQEKRTWRHNGQGDKNE